MKSISRGTGSKYPLILLLIIAFGLNFNTLFHEYALDDIVVMTENKFVIKGISGIPEILTNDLMSGYSTKQNLLTEPRYRPFSSIIFAIEYQLAGANPFVSHLINVLFFMLLIALLYRLLKDHLFRDQNENLAFITCLLFAVHPIHTEVIANVKSRDELITFILLISSLTLLIRHTEIKKKASLLLSLLFFFFALLTRESAVTFIGIIPFVFYFFFNQPLIKSIKKSFPFIAVFVVYMLIRFSVIGLNKPVVSDILNAPFLYATSSQAFATKIYIILKYLLILIFPHPLSSDYSYNQIPYIEISSFKFILALTAIIILIIAAFKSFRSKSILSFSIIYFTITISLVSNLVIDIGTPFSERLLFQPSLAFCIAVAYLFTQILKKPNPAWAAILAVIVILFSLKTFLRNIEWKNNETLYIADAVSAPNSARTTLFASEIYRDKAKKETRQEIKQEYLDKSVYYGERSLKINPDLAVSYLHVGFSYFDQSKYDKAADLWMTGYKKDPSDPEAKKCLEVLSDIYYKQGNGLSEQNKTDDAIRSYLKSIELNPDNTEAWYNLGGNYFMKNDTANGYEAWNKVKRLDSNHPLDKKEFIKENFN